MKYEDKFQIDDILQSINLLEQESASVSDRSYAIVCAAFLDDFLERLILSFLTAGSSSQDKLLLENNGALSTFSAKIVLAFRLGLISKKEYDNLTLIRKIRNAFAHDMKTNSFDDSKIKSILLENIPDEKLLPPISIPLRIVNNGMPQDIPTTEFLQYLSDEKMYAEIADKFPKIRFRELDQNNPRSVFCCIVHVLHACLNSRLLFAIAKQRESLENFTDIIEIENCKTAYFNNLYSNQMIRLQNLKKDCEEQIAKIDNLITSNHQDAKLVKTKNEFVENLREINESISDLKKPLSIEHACQIHTYWLLKYQLSRKNDESEQ